MKRGPYKSYLRPEGDGIMPRSTFYDKLKKYRCNVPNVDSNIDNQNLGTYNANENDRLIPEKIFNENNLLSVGTEVEADDLMNISQNSTTIHSAPNSWLYEDYNEEFLHREFWFDAEDSPQVEDRYVDDNDTFTQEAEEENGLKENFHEPLCKCSTMTRGEALMMALALGAEESLTWKTIISILSMINTLFQNDVVPASKYKLFKILNN